LKKQGASRSATLSFLISTPETGMDSIPITYALIDPLMAVIRPVAAFFTAVVAGLAENLFGREEAEDAMADLQPVVFSGQKPRAGGMLSTRQPLLKKVSDGMQYAFVELLGDIGRWFILGVLLAGFIITLVPEDLIGSYLGNPLLAMLAMLVVGMPMYVCATSSTPIAAALILKGLNPGAALVFLLAGPATNAATLSMVSGLLGKRSVVIYLSAIVACSFAMGLIADFLYATFQIQPMAIAGQAGEILPGWLKIGAAFLLTALFAYAFWKTRKPSGKAPCACADACCSGK
jgi:uncharacterized membrane protein YraQ (UPF0718 family)